MHKYLFGPARRWGYLAVVVLLASALFWVSCSEKQPASTAPQQQPVALSAVGLNKVMEVQNRHTDRLMAIEGVVGTATGLSAEGKPVVKVYAERQGVAGIPSTVDGIPVEVEVTGKFYALALTKRYRPVPIGVSVGNDNECSAGTIGCVVEKGGQKYILSNNHVLARQNAASIGEDIVQPGRYDSKPKCAHIAANKVADLSAFVPIVFSTSANNRVDAAIALYSTTDITCATLPNYYGFPSSTTVAAFVGQSVKKVGRTSSLSTGTVTAINATVNVGYSAGTARFTGQIVTTSISRSGDSGSLVVTNDANNNPVGLLYAGSSTTTVLNPINEVLSTSQMGNLTICSQ
ncbi:MAG: S1 family peptidase [candidate division Zixibacteria bacterium]|nr:S1 family peptidase [candidate division Zixibacteria bacterium]